MSYNSHVLQVLEFDQVRTLIVSFADSEEGRATISKIVPSRDSETARALLA